MTSINLDGIARRKRTDIDQNNPFGDQNYIADGFASKDQSPVSFQ